MASRQFQLDNEIFVNAASNGREAQISNETYFLEEAADEAAPIFAQIQMSYVMRS